MDELLERVLGWFGKLLLAIVVGLIWAGFKDKDKNRDNPIATDHASPRGALAETAAPSSGCQPNLNQDAPTVIFVINRSWQSSDCSTRVPASEPQVRVQPRVWVRSCR